MSEMLRDLLMRQPSSPGSGMPDIRPLFFRMGKKKDETALSGLLKEKPFIRCYDTIHDQLSELIKNFHPADKLSEEVVEEAVAGHLAGRPEWAYGVWVYYPWNDRLLHILDEKEFTELRTIRNLYKITRQEQNLLATKKIGVIGLSAGQSVALTLAMERSFGELRIADLDVLDLSNLNRLRTGIHNLGFPKTVIVAREIAEIDPFLKITCFHEGIHENNIDDFIHNNGKLDMLIDESDSLDIKILCRLKARSARIPVMMDTCYRGMIDIERFDLEPEREILHGLVGDMDYGRLKNLTTEQKLPYILKMIGMEGQPLRSKVSLIEIGQSIPTWPQLSSAVALGGAAIADVSRRALIDELHISGRFYLDVEAAISDPPVEKKEKFKINNPYAPLTKEDMKQICSRLPPGIKVKDNISPGTEVIKRMVLAAGKSPSSGNDQPWKWMYQDGTLFLFHDMARSFSFGDYKNIGSYVSLGMALENLVLSAHEQGIELSLQLFPDPCQKQLIATIHFFNDPTSFTEIHQTDELSAYIDSRCTNRKIAGRTVLSPNIYQKLIHIAQMTSGASLFFADTPGQLQELGEIISAIDKIRILHPHGHYDFFHREMRWTSEEAMSKRDGMDIATLEIPQSALTALEIVAEEDVINMIREINGGDLFKSVSIRSVTTASAMGLLAMNNNLPEDYINGGRAAQRIWLKTTQLNLALQPIIAPLYLFPRILNGGGEGLTPAVEKELWSLKKRFERLFPLAKDLTGVFLFRVLKAEPVSVRSLRLPLEDILITK